MFCNFLFFAKKDSLALAIAMAVPRGKLQLETQRLSNLVPMQLQTSILTALKEEEPMNETSCFSTSSLAEVVNKAEPDKRPRRRYLISALLALIAFDSVVSSSDAGSVSRLLAQDQAFLESARSQCEIYCETVRSLVDRL